MTIRNIERLYNVIENSLFTINGKLCYDRVTDAIIALCREISETETDETLWYIGEHGYASLDSLIVGAYWHYTEWHGGQYSKSYAALCCLGDIFDPGFSGLDMDSSEYDVYLTFHDMAANHKEKEIALADMWSDYHD